MLRRDFTLAALSAPFAGLLKGNRCAAIMLDDASGDGSLSDVQIISRTPPKLWDTREEMMEFVCNVQNLCCSQNNVHCELFFNVSQSHVLGTRMRYFGYEIEGSFVDFFEDMRFWTPEDAADEIERRFEIITQSLRVKVLGFKETI
jgi:hypothetical protein